jgi:hypothetical protein
MVSISWPFVLARNCGYREEREVVGEPGASDVLGAAGE